ncbi:MAG: hypothetical protein EPO23_12260 [Xanthobacteraceae bacterium]|nr:MAG: hypothetical protein EPO23_12260 [Xanthobacteraceae bacterium]
MGPTERGTLDLILRRDFLAFCQMCFYELNPGKKFESNWHIEVLAYHLNKITSREIKHLLVLMPPRCLKSTIVSVAWPAFILGRKPSARIIDISYGEALTNKLSDETRRIMRSDWYHRIFSGTVINPSKDAVERFETTQNGYRMATSIGGALTGFGGDYLIIDDPNKPSEIDSEASRKKTKDWLLNTALSRLDDPKKGGIVMVMQRIGVDDLADTFMNFNDVTTLIIPAYAERDFSYEIRENKKYIYRAGEYLQPQRYGAKEIESLRQKLGTRNFEAQYQQNPIPQEGGLFHWKWFLPCEAPPACSELVMSVDVAATEGGGNYTAMLLLGHRDGCWYIIAAHRFQHDLTKVRNKIVELDQIHRPDLIVIDGGGVGRGLCQQFKVDGYNYVWPTVARRSKQDNAAHIAPMIERGNVFYVATAPGLKEFRDEIVTFPESKNDDFVDALTQVLCNSSNAISFARRYKRPERADIRSKTNQLDVKVLHLNLSNFMR